MRYYTLLLALFLFATNSSAQFTPGENGLTIIVTDGTFEGRKSDVQPPGDAKFQDPIRSLGMAEAIQAGAFIERPQYGLSGYLLVFCVNDAIGEEQATLIVNGEVLYGIYRLIRQKMTPDEEIPEGMQTYRLKGTVYFLGIS